MYPDSAPSNWKDILIDTHVNICVSPLHDKDKNPTGEDKKPHWHVVVMFDNTKTVKQAEEISSKLNATVPIPVQSVNGMIRYLIHKDNPEKAQYNKEDITVIGFYDIDEAFKNSIDKYNTIGEMIDYIEMNNITEFFMFLKYCREEKEDWFKSLCDSSYIIREYITSKRNYLKDLEEKSRMM